MEELTLVDLMEKLARLEETYLVELLQLDSEILVTRFQDLIEDRFEELQAEIEEQELDNET